jgi:hypothetical protein
VLNIRMQDVWGDVERWHFEQHIFFFSFHAARC